MLHWLRWLLQGTPEGVENNGSITRVGTFPIGIDPERFTHALETDEVQSHVAKLLMKYAGRKVRCRATWPSC
jgi:trehalose 6-phosphate synthase/phosphatase